jgi:hypothetical protein
MITVQGRFRNSLLRGADRLLSAEVLGVTTSWWLAKDRAGVLAYSGPMHIAAALGRHV